MKITLNPDTTDIPASTIEVAIHTDGHGTYQARCLGCPWVGPWRDRAAGGLSREDRAVADASAHRHQVCGAEFTVAPGVTLVCGKTYDPTDVAKTHGAYHLDARHQGGDITWTGDDTTSAMLAQHGDVWGLIEAVTARRG